MHFKLDLKKEKKKKTLLKKWQKCHFFFQNIWPFFFFFCPFWFFFLKNGTLCGIFGRMKGRLKKVLPRDKCGVPLMVWKEGGRDERVESTFLPPLGQSVVSRTLWNNPRSRFFEFPLTVFIVHGFFLAAPASVGRSSSSLRWTRSIPLGQNGGSYLWGVSVLLGAAVYLKTILFVVFLLLFSSLVVLPTTFILSPSGRYWECLWSSKGAFPLPRLPKISQMSTYTFNRHIHYRLFHPVSQSSERRSRRLFLNTLDALQFGPVELVV